MAWNRFAAAARSAIAAGGWGVRPSRPTRGRAALVFPVEVVSTMEFDFFLRGVLFSRGTTEFDLGRLSRHASEGFLRFIFFKVT